MKYWRLSSIVLGITSLILVQFKGMALGSTPLLPKFQAGSLVADAIRYTPPAGLGTPKRTQGGGSRGCNQALPVSFTLLVPIDHVGLTRSAHPTFAWYISGDTTTPMKFSLTEPGVNPPVWTQEVTSQKAGINTLVIPDHTPELAVGKRYRWTLSQTCNSKRTAALSAASGWVQRVEVKTETAVALNPSPIAPAQLLAQKGLWYDAVAALASAYLAMPPDQLAAQSLMALLDQGGLKQVTEQERKRLKIN
jgi:hypothetical protein